MRSCSLGGFLRSFVRSFVCVFVRLFVCSFVRLFFLTVGSFAGRRFFGVRRARRSPVGGRRAVLIRPLMRSSPLACVAGAREMIVRMKAHNTTVSLPNLRSRIRPAHAEDDAACNMQHATCNIQHATYNMQHATPPAHAEDDTIFATCNMQHATPPAHTEDDAACNMQNATCTMQHHRRTRQTARGGPTAPLRDRPMPCGAKRDWAGPCSHPCRGCAHRCPHLRRGCAHPCPHLRLDWRMHAAGDPASVEVAGRLPQRERAPTAHTVAASAPGPNRSGRCLRMRVVGNG